ncbi:hypothetical protein AHAS_Ahas19G0138800 [Arachis hypogaea]
MSFDDYSSSSEDEDTREEQVAQHLGALMKLNDKLFGTKPLEEEPPLLSKDLNALVHQELPQKLPDPGRFLIPCTIGTMTFEKALCDLGSSIIIEKMGIQKGTRITLQKYWMVFKVLDPPLPPDKGGTCIKDSASKPPPLDGTNSIPPKTKRKFDVRCTLSTKEEGLKRKIPRG